MHPPKQHSPCVVQGEQLVKEFSKPLKVIFTELAVGLENDYHCCPQVQLVITLKGSWCAAFVKCSLHSSCSRVSGCNCMLADL